MSDFSLVQLYGTLCATWIFPTSPHTVTLLILHAMTIGWLAFLKHAKFKAQIVYKLSVH